MKKLATYLVKLMICIALLYFILKFIGVDINNYIGDGFNVSNILEDIEIVTPTTPNGTVPIETQEITDEEIQKLVNSIKVSSNTPKEGYNRDDFEKPTKSFKLNGKNLTRNKYSIYTSAWLVSEEPFEYLCPYTGQTITDITKLDFEHIIALNYIYKYGDIDWDNAKKNEFAYDLRIGTPVLNSANRSKSDKGPSDWLPNYRNEDFCYSWLWIASNYGIALRQADIDVCVREIEKGLSNGETLELLMQYK